MLFIKSMWLLLFSCFSYRDAHNYSPISYRCCQWYYVYCWGLSVRLCIRPVSFLMILSHISLGKIYNLLIKFIFQRTSKQTKPYLWGYDTTSGMNLPCCKFYLADIAEIGHKIVHILNEDIYSVIFQKYFEVLPS